MTLSPKSLSRMRELITEYELQPVEDQILAESVECVTILCGQPDNGEKLGTSRYGGLPDLPASLKWPQFPADYYRPNAFPQFILQVNLADLPLMPDDTLPRHGMLYFFATCEGDGLVLFHPTCSGLEQATKPPSEEIINENIEDIQPHHLHFTVGVDVPNSCTPISEIVKSTMSLLAVHELSYLAMKAINESNADLAGSIFGSPFGIHEDFRKSAAIMKFGLREHRWDQEELRAHLPAIEVEKENWLLLLRVESVLHIGACFGDAGNINVMIRKDDLERLDFSKVYIEMSST